MEAEPRASPLKRKQRQRFRPSDAALSGIRQYHATSPEVASGAAAKEARDAKRAKKAAGTAAAAAAAEHDRSAPTPPRQAKRKRQRFRPSDTALSGIRQYNAASSPGKGKAADDARSEGGSGGYVHVRRMATQRTKCGRFLRRHSGNKPARLECEPTLMHIVSTFAAEVGRAAAEFAAERSAHKPNAATEEGDIERALARLRDRTIPPSARTRARGEQTLHPALLEEAPS